MDDGTDNTQDDGSNPLAGQTAQMPSAQDLQSVVPNLPNIATPTTLSPQQQQMRAALSKQLGNVSTAQGSGGTMQSNGVFNSYNPGSNSGALGALAKGLGGYASGEMNPNNQNSWLNN